MKILKWLTLWATRRFNIGIAIEMNVCNSKINTSFMVKNCINIENH